MVRAIDDSVSVIGTADMMYKLSLPLEINVYSRLRVLLDQLEGSTSTAQICLYEELDTFTLELCPSRCFTLTRGSNDIALAKAFYFRKTRINYVRIRQAGSTGSTLESHTSILTKISFGLDVVPIADDRGVCSSVHALSVKSPQGYHCKCLDGFIASSSGRKKQGDFDACVSCLSLPTCLNDRVNILASEVKGTCANVSITDDWRSMRLYREGYVTQH